LPVIERCSFPTCTEEAAVALCQRPSRTPRDLKAVEIIRSEDNLTLLRSLLPCPTEL